jgi:nitrogen fixation protein NifZ
MRRSLSGAEDLRCGLLRMPMQDDETVELYDPPAFQYGDKVRALKNVRNDGTFPGKNIGDELIAEGDVGYVASVGTFLQRYFIYGIDFIERGKIVGMRAKELELISPAPEPRDGP